MPKKTTTSSSPTKRRFDKLAMHHHWLAHAEHIATQPISRGGSPHPSVKVGAVLVDAKGKVIAASSNRFAQGVDRRRPERYEEGSKSLWINCAEQFALAGAMRKRSSLKGARMYVTLEPCAVCAGIISEVGLKHVFVPVGAMRRYAKLKSKWKNSIEIGLIKLAEAGVTVTAIDVKKPK